MTSCCQPRIGMFHSGLNGVGMIGTSCAVKPNDDTPEETVIAANSVINSKRVNRPNASCPNTRRAARLNTLIAGLISSRNSTNTTNAITAISVEDI